MFNNGFWARVGLGFFELVAILVLAGCGLLGQEIQILDQPSCEDIVFTSEDEPVNAILCLPAGPQKDLPAVVYLHGGVAYEPLPEEYLPEGEEAMHYTFHEKLAERGLVVLSILYYSRTPPPEGAEIPNTFIGVDDMERIRAWPIWISTIEDGLSYMQTRSEVDPERISLVGYSQGGSLALALDQDINNFAALVLISGYYSTQWDNFTAGDTPTLILQAEQDDVVAMSEALMIKDSLEERGVEHEFVVIQGAPHNWYGQASQEGFDAVVDFLESYIGPSGP